MTAGIMKGPQIAVSTTNNQDRPVPDIECAVITWLLKFRLEPRKEPRLAVDRRHVERDHARVVIQKLAEGVSRFTRGKLGRYMLKIQYRDPLCRTRRMAQHPLVAKLFLCMRLF